MKEKKLEQLGQKLIQKEEPLTGFSEEEKSAMKREWESIQMAIDL